MPAARTFIVLPEQLMMKLNNGMYQKKWELNQMFSSSLLNTLLMEVKAGNMHMERQTAG